MVGRGGLFSNYSGITHNVRKEFSFVICVMCTFILKTKSSFQVFALFNNVAYGVGTYFIYLEWKSAGEAAGGAAPATAAVPPI